jgi:3-oxoacyl-(acyl-carrier-protein) synthase
MSVRLMLSPGQCYHSAYVISLSPKDFTGHSLSAIGPKMATLATTKLNYNTILETGKYNLLSED